jgi:hypothetical protein
MSDNSGLGLLGGDLGLWRRKEYTFGVVNLSVFLCNLAYERLGVFLQVEDRDIIADVIGETRLEDLQVSRWASRNMRR